ncbi:hypothetical protein [Actinocatenispora comari]|uniref:hypothetical protein n=1 Tax=Actinocatenispora comari TaxID=2807577 RepID=UPI001A92277D|nr:hypothetical protein [Actinocatenispora comari]
METKRVRRRPIRDAWRDAAWEYLRAAERLARLTEDDRFAGDVDELFRIGGRLIADADLAMTTYHAHVDQIDKKTRQQVLIGRVLPRTERAFLRSVTGESFGDGSGDAA